MHRWQPTQDKIHIITRHPLTPSYILNCLSLPQRLIIANPPPRNLYHSSHLHNCLPLILTRPPTISSPPRRHNPPTYEEDQAADPYVYNDGDEPSYDDPNYLGEDPNPRLANEERQETDEDLAMMHQREADAEAAADADEFEGDIDADDDWLEQGRDEESVRRETAERESRFGREELDDTYDVEEDDDD